MKTNTVTIVLRCKDNFVHESNKGDGSAIFFGRLRIPHIGNDEEPFYSVRIGVSVSMKQIEPFFSRSTVTQTANAKKAKPFLEPNYLIVTGRVTKSAEGSYYLKADSVKEFEVERT